MWTLSFDEGCKKEFVAGGVVETLRSFPLEHKGVKRGIEGALWNLNEKQTTKQVASPKQQDTGKPGQVMISYSWGQQTRMRQLGAHLKALGFPIWIDVEQMEGSVLGKMAEAVEESSTIIIGLSSTYKDSQACRTEAEYSYRLKKDIIFVVAEEGFVAKGWLGALLGVSLWYSPWSDQSGFESGVAPVIKQLTKQGAEISERAVVANKPSPSSTPSISGAPGNDQIVGLLREVLQKMDTLSTQVSSLETTTATRLGSLQEQLTNLSARVDTLQALPPAEDSEKKTQKKKGRFF